MIFTIVGGEQRLCKGRPVCSPSLKILGVPYSNTLYAAKYTELTSWPGSQQQRGWEIEKNEVNPSESIKPRALHFAKSLREDRAMLYVDFRTGLMARC